MSKSAKLQGLATLPVARGGGRGLKASKSFTRDVFSFTASPLWLGRTCDLIYSINIYKIWSIAMSSIISIICIICIICIMCIICIIWLICIICIIWLIWLIWLIYYIYTDASCADQRVWSLCWFQMGST